MTVTEDDVKVAVFELGSVKEMVNRFKGRVLLKEIQYTIPPTPIFGEECLNQAVKSGHALKHPAVYATKVSDFKVIGGAAFPIIQNKSIPHQYFSTDKWETWEQAANACRIQMDQRLIGYAHLTEPNRFEHQIINLIGNGSFNYAHWLTEYLPQLVLLKDAGVDFSEYKVLVDVASFPSMLESLYLLGVKKEQLMFVGTLALTEFPKALWVSPVANIVFQRPDALRGTSSDAMAEPQHATFHPKAIQATRDAYVKLLDKEASQNAPQKIFIRRTPGRKKDARTVINEDEVQALLESQGFVTVDPSGLSFIEQVTLFSHAKFIVAASGAALVNMIWAPAGAKIIVLMNDSKVTNYWYFSNIAFAAGHRLSYVLGKVIDTGIWSDVNHADFEIKPQALIDALRYFGIEVSLPDNLDLNGEDLPATIKESDGYFPLKTEAIKNALSFLPALESAIDIGCGEGAYTLLLAQKVKNINAYDLSEKRVQNAKKRAATLNLENICFEALSDNQILFRHRVDLVCCNEFASSIVDDQEFSRLFATFKRGVVNHGYLLVLDKFSMEEDKLIGVSSRFNVKQRNVNAFKAFVRELGFNVELESVVVEDISAGYTVRLFVLKNGVSQEGFPGLGLSHSPQPEFERTGASVAPASHQSLQQLDEGGPVNATLHNAFTVDRIGFLVHSLELVNHFACVWDLLPEHSFDVLLHGDAVTTDAACFLRWKCNVVTVDNVIHSNTNYQYLVSNHPVSLGDLPLIKQLAKINVRFMYAAGKSGWNFSEWNNLYDVILCFGPYHAAAFSDKTDAIVLQMGYPRFDRYFTNQPDMSDLQARYNCDPLKKTVVWLPTWKTLSSVSHFDEEISLLTESYNVIVKLHPLMPESEPERVEALMRYNFTHLITDTSDNLPLYQIADFMLFDYGGPPLAGIYADKNLILLNIPDADKDNLTGDDSPDITIRKYLTNVNAADGSIARLLADSSLWEEQQAVRKMLRKYYFAPYFGFASNVAAEALLNLKHMIGKGAHL